MFESSLNRPSYTFCVSSRVPLLEHSTVQKIVNFEDVSYVQKMQGLDGDPIDFKWKNFPGAKALDILHKNQADLQRKNITPEKFSDRKIFMSMFHDIELEKKDFEDSCALTSRKIKDFGTRRRKQVVPSICSQIWWEVGSSCVSKLVNFESSRHSVFQGVSPLGLGILRSETTEKTIHFNG